MPTLLNSLWRTPFHLVVLVSTLILLFPLRIVANSECEQTCNQEDSGEKMACISDKKRCLEAKLTETQAQKTTVANTISILNGKIKIQELQINQTMAELELLEAEVADLEGRITGLNLSLDRLTSMLVERIRTQYKRSKTSALTFITDEQPFSRILAQQKHLTLAGTQTAFAMERAENQRLVFDEQKLLKERKQEEVAKKRAQLEQEKASLAGVRTEQQNFLTITQSNERRYQELIAAAQKELQQIQNAANLVIREGNAIPVNRGEIIGTMGNSGFSTGAHLHFSVYKYTVKEFQNTGSWGWYYSNYVNPLDMLEPMEINWATGCSHDPSGKVTSGSGSWKWPMTEVRMTQNYGSNTCYNFMYGGRPHPALDMVGMGDISVRSVADGEAYFCRNCLKDGGNGVFVFHDGGYMTLYWHLK